MKTLTVTLTLLMFSGVASAQNPDPSKWMCRNLSESGGFLYQGETIFGSQACRPVQQSAPAAPSAAPATPKQEPENTPVATVPVTASAPATSQPSSAPTAATTPPPAVSGQPAPQTRPCLIVRQAEGHRFRNSMIAGALTGGIGFAAGAASGGAKYEYVDSFHLSGKPELKYSGKELQKLEEGGVHVVTVSKKAAADEIKDARESCKE
jgi:hypothetical protein